MKVFVLGQGRVGSALTTAARHAGHQVEVHSYRSFDFRNLNDVELAIIATRDDAIIEAAQRLAAAVDEKCVIAHCSGSTPASALSSISTSSGVMHPMVSFASPSLAPPMSKAVFLIDGNAKSTIRSFVESLGATAIDSEAHGAPYHAGAVMLASGTIALAKGCTDIWQEQGIPTTTQSELLASLLHSIAYNLSHLSPSDALSGPIARNHHAKIQEHLGALTGNNADVYTKTIDLVKSILGTTE